MQAKCTTITFLASLALGVVFTFVSLTLSGVAVGKVVGDSDVSSSKQATVVFAYIFTILGVIGIVVAAVIAAMAYPIFYVKTRTVDVNSCCDTHRCKTISTSAFMLTLCCVVIAFVLYIVSVEGIAASQSGIMVAVCFFLAMSVVCCCVCSFTLHGVTKENRAKFIDNCAEFIDHYAKHEEP